MAVVRTFIGNVRGPAGPQGDTPPIINDLSSGGADKALSAEMGRILGNRMGENLLDNSDWTNPVNQKHGYCVKPGVRMYSDPGLSEDSYVSDVQTGALATYVNEVYSEVNGKYVATSDLTSGYSNTSTKCIDRWRTATAIRVEIKGGYITLTCFSQSTANGITQDIPKEKTPSAGTKITLAIGCADGKVYIGSADMPEEGTRNNPINNTNDPFYTRLYGVNYDSTPSLARVSIMVRPSQSIDIKWLALYEGEYTIDTLPPYQPKGYGVELLECQRYYQLFSSEEARPSDLVDYRPTMRINPAVGTISVDGVTRYYADASI